MIRYSLIILKSILCRDIAQSKVLDIMDCSSYLRQNLPQILKTLRSSLRRSMKVQYIELSEFGENNYSYLVTDEQTGASAVIDPAAPESVLPWLKTESGARIEQLWTTHHHSDHANGNKKLLETYPFLKVYGSDDRIPAVSIKPKDREVWKLGSLSVHALYTIGHTTGCISYYVVDDTKNETCVFTGDTLFIGGCGRFFEGTPENMYNSLCKVLAPLPPATKVWVGHEYTMSNLKFAAAVEPENKDIKKALEGFAEKKVTIPSTIAQELLINPFMRVDTPALQNLSGISDPVVLMGKLREMKNKGTTSFSD